MFSSLALRTSTRALVRAPTTPSSFLTKLTLNSIAPAPVRCFTATTTLGWEDRGDRPSRGGYGGRSYGDRDGRSSGRGGFGGMSRGGRGGSFGSRGGRGGSFGGRKPYGSSFGDEERGSHYSMQSQDSKAMEDAEHEVDTTVDAENEVKDFQDLADRGMIDPSIIKTITEGMGYKEMTKVQRKTITATLAGGDVLAQAKTGTGKTIAFLLPALQRMVTSPQPLKQRQIDIRCVIISPTRELAQQIEKDAVRLTKGLGIVTQCAVGGTGKGAMLSGMRRNGCHLLIATPGRLNDLLTDEYLNLDCSSVDTLVFDEGDTLLDQGFAVAIEKIVKHFPAKDSMVRNGEGRQTLIFSATMPQKVIQMVQKNLRPDYKFLRMVSTDEKPVHEHVKQHFVKCKGFENLIPTIYELCVREQAEHKDFKAIVFCPTVKLTHLAAETFFKSLGRRGEPNPLADTTVVEIHSKLSQPQRTRAAERFRNSPRAIMFGSDVIARGMDFPKVTHVIQVSTPSNQEQYIHRLGRTARGAETKGIGYLVVAEHEAQESSFRSIVKGLDLIENEHNLHSHAVEMDKEQQLPAAAADSLSRVMAASQLVDVAKKGDVYKSLLGYFGSTDSRQGLVNALNRWALLGWGMQAPPGIPAALVQKLGYGKVQGINTYSPSRGMEDRGDRGDGAFERRSFGGDRRSGGFGGDRGDRGDRGGERRGGFAPRHDRDRGDVPNWKRKVENKFAKRREENAW